MRKLTIIGITAIALMTSGAQAQGLTDQQEVKLAEISQGFSQQATVFDGLMQNKLTELAIELQREGRFASEETAAEAAAAPCERAWSSGRPWASARVKPPMKLSPAPTRLTTLTLAAFANHP